MDEDFLIHIEIAGGRYPITIRRDEEEIMRAAAKQVNQLFHAYQKEYVPTAYKREDWLAIIAVHLSKEVLQLEAKYDISPFEERIRELTEELGRYLANK